MSDDVKITAGPFVNASVPYLPHNYASLNTYSNKTKALNVLMAVLSMKWRDDDSESSQVHIVEVGGIRFSDQFFSMFFFGPIASQPSLEKKDELRKLLGDISIYSICYNAAKPSTLLHKGEYLMGCLQIDISMGGLIVPVEEQPLPAIIVTTEPPSRKRTQRETDEDNDYTEVETSCKRPSFRACAETVLDQCSIFGRLFNRIVNISSVDDLVEDGID